MWTRGKARSRHAAGKLSRERERSITTEDVLFEKDCDNYIETNPLKMGGKDHLLGSGVNSMADKEVMFVESISTRWYS